MSRIGNNPISIPDGVSVSVNGDVITVKGKNGEMNQNFDGVSFNISDNTIIVKRNSESKDHKSKHGLYRALVFNMVTGVSDGFTLELELVGVGYRADASGQKLDLSLGFSHTIVMNIAPEVKVETINEKGKNPIIKLSSPDKQLVGHVAAKIRSFRRPEPYKGKGIKFVGEQIRRKAGNQHNMTNTKTFRRNRIRQRIKKVISGTPDYPRLSVFRSNKEIYCQVIDDVNGKTLLQASSRDKTILDLKLKTNIEISFNVGKLVAEQSIKKGIEKIKFDRGGYLYHGRVKSLAEGAREGGLKF